MDLAAVVDTFEEVDIVEDINMGFSIEDKIISFLEVI